jgi:flagellar protein FliS
MFGSMYSGANAYAKVGVETGVVAASPHKLIVMLYDGAILSLNMALQHIRAGQVAAKGQAISKAITIVESGLRASLNKEVGGEIAINLDSLYAYMVKRLIEANLGNKEELIEEVQRLLQDLRETWNRIDPAAGSAAAGQLPHAPANDPLAPNMTRLIKA